MSMNKADTERLLTPEDVSVRLQINIVTVYRWLKDGKLRGTKLSRKMWRIAESDFNDLMKGEQDGGDK